MRPGGVRGGEHMKITIEGEEKEIATLLLELEVQRKVPFVGEVRYCSLDKQNAHTTDESVKEAP